MRTPSFRQRVIRLNNEFNNLHELIPSQAAWAWQHATHHIAYYRDNKNGKYVCLDCGHEWSIKGKSAARQVTCPHCGQVLDVEVSRKYTYDKMCYMVLPQTLDDMQVLRVFEHRQSINLRKGFTNRESANIWCEVVRSFYGNEPNEVRITSRAMYMSWNNLSPWRWNSELKLRTPSCTYYTHRDNVENSYAEISAPICPISARLKGEYAMRGITVEQMQGADVSLSRLIRFVKRHPPIETMLKAGYAEMADHYASMLEHASYHLTTSALWTAMKIVIRNHYTITDAQMYIDYLYDLVRLERDLHNAHYVCPADLRAAHTAATMERQRREERERIKRERERQQRELAEAVKHEAAYRKDKERYFGIAFGEDSQHLQIAVIKSVADMKAEGFAMHHCVGGYWDRKDSLILSCRDADGKRLATIEVNLKDFTIVQTRGVCNQVPEHKDLINRTIMAHMNEIRMAKSSRRKAPKKTNRLAASLNAIPEHQPAALAV